MILYRKTLNLKLFLIYLSSLITPCLVMSQTNGCDEGVIKLPDRSGTIQICSAIAARVPELANQLKQATSLIGSQQAQLTELTRLVRGLNNVSRGIDLKHQTGMLQSLSNELGNNSKDNGADTLGKINERLDNLQASLLGALSDPKTAAALGDALKGPLAEAIAKLDLSGASKQIEDIGERLKALQTSVSGVRSDTTAIRQQLDQMENRQKNDDNARKERDVATIALLKRLSGEVRELGQSGGLINDPHTFAAYYHNARILSQRGEFDLSFDSYRQVLQTGIQMADPIIDLTTLLIRKYGRQGAVKAFTRDFEKNIPRLSYLYGLQTLADKELDEVEELLFAKPELISDFPPLATIYLRRLQERIANKSKEKINLYTFQWSDRAGIIRVAQRVDREIESGNYLAFFIDQIRGGRDLDDFRAISEIFTADKLLQSNSVNLQGENYPLIKVDFNNSPIALDYTYFIDPPSREVLTLIAQRSSGFPKYKKGSLFINIWDTALDKEKPVKICAGKGDTAKCKDINEPSMKCNSSTTVPPLNCSNISEFEAYRYLSPYLFAHIVPEELVSSVCLSSISYTTRSGSEIKIDAKNLIGFFRRSMDEEIQNAINKCGYDLLSTQIKSNKTEQTLKKTNFASIQNFDRLVEYNRQNCEMLGQKLFRISYLDSTVVGYKMNEYLLKIAKAFKTLPEVPSYEKYRGRFDDASKGCYLDLIINEQPYACKVANIVASKWLPPNSQFDYKNSNNFVDDAKVFNGGVFPDLNSPIECELSKDRLEAFQKKTLPKKRSVDQLSTLESSSIEAKLANFGAGYSDSCQTIGFTAIRYRISVDLGLRIIEKNVCVDENTLRKAKLENALKISELQIIGCFTAQGMSQYKKEVEEWLSTTALNCKSDAGTKAKELAKNSAEWAVDQR